MEEMQLYEYAVLRYVPRVERGEFINIGLAMMCKRRRWLRLRLHLDPARCAAFSSDLDFEALRRQLAAFENIAEGASSAGPIAGYPGEERFRWLTAEKSACIQSSRPHPGLTDDLDATFHSLFNELVL